MIATFIKNFRLKSLIVFAAFFLSFLQIYSQSKVVVIADNKQVSGFRISDTSQINTKLSDYIAKLNRKGFILASFDSLIYSNDTIYALLNYNKKFFFGKIDVCNFNSANFSTFSNKPANFSKLSKLVKSNLKELTNNGYPFAKFYYNQITIKDSVVDLQICLDSGNFVRFDTVFFDSKVRISPKFLQNYLQCNKNKPFNYSAFQSFDQRIKMLESVQITIPSEVEFHNHTADVYLYLQNRKTNSFSALIGFTNNNRKFQLVGEAKARFVNTFKINDELIFNWQNSGNSSQNLKVYTSFPYVFGTKLGITNAFIIDKVDTSYVNIFNKSNFEFFISALSNISLFANFSQSVVIDTSVVLNNFTKYFYGFAYNIKTIDDFNSPTKGFNLDLSFGVGNKKNYKIQHKQWLATFDFALYRIFFGKFVAKISSFTYILQGDSLQKSELYRFGGATAMRGFDQNSLLASGLSVNTVELRYLFAPKSFFFIFTDYSVMQNKTTETNYWLHPFSLGTGVQLKTKAGLLKLTYALGKSEQQIFELRNSRFHFDFATVF